MSFLKKNIPQILVHIFLWSALFGMLSYPFLAYSQALPNDLLLKMVTAIVLFYFNYYFLVPYFLLNGKKIIYLILSVTIVGLIVYIFHKTAPQMEIREFPRPMRRMSPLRREIFALRFPMIPFVIFSIPLLFSTMLRVYFSWQKNESLRKTIEKEKVESELQFLKAQLNPHFLFNSLNTIYSLSVKKSKDTSDAIINLSELMRYMLYEADKENVPLSKEIEYIKSYVALQRLRLADSENVHLKISGDDNNKNIPPLLFISFIENAFKYGTDYNGKTMVKINFLIQEAYIHFSVINKIGVIKKNDKSSGLGLENIKNRLKYLYPNSHILDITDDGKTYEVDLKINF